MVQWLGGKDVRQRAMIRRDPVTAQRLAARRLRLWRRVEEISQAQLAEACRVSRSTVRRWERDDSPSAPTVAQMILAAQAVGAQPADVLGFLGGGGRL